MFLCATGHARVCCVGVVQLTAPTGVKSYIMKSAALLTLIALGLVGCTTTTETMHTTRMESRSGATPIDQNRAIAKRTYTHDDIQKTGRSGNVGEALSTLDPSVYVSGGR